MRCYMKTPLPSVLPRWVIQLFFWIGLTAAVCVRSLSAVSQFDPAAALWVWRFAMLCYIFFFGYRYWIGRRRRRVVAENRLVEHVQSCQSMDPVVREATLYVLRSITRSKELFNYGVIFLLSLLALGIDLVILLRG